MNRDVSLVFFKESESYRKIAQKWYGLTDEQMAGMDVHHNPPRSKGGRNIPEHLYVYHPTLHSVIHESNFVVWSRTGAKKVHEKKNEDGKSVVAVKAAATTNETKDKNGKSINALKGAEKIHKERDELGRSLHSLKVNATKNEDGKSVNAVKGAKTLNQQVWESIVDGFRSGASQVAQHNRANGWDPGDRRRIR